MKHLQRGEAMLCAVKAGSPWFDQFAYVDAHGTFVWWFFGDDGWTDFGAGQNVFLNDFADCTDFHTHRFWL